jgi:hypothetical protein
MYSQSLMSKIFASFPLSSNLGSCIPSLSGLPCSCGRLADAELKHKKNNAAKHVSRMTKSIVLNWTEAIADVAISVLVGQLW